VNNIRIFKNTTYQALARIATSGIGFLIAIVLARNFGASGYGEYIKITSFVSLFYLISDFGLNAIFLQAERKDLKFKDLFYLRILISLVLFALVNVIAVMLPYQKDLGFGFSPSVKFGIFIFSFSLFAQAILFSQSVIFQKKLRFDFLTKALTAGSALSLVFIVIFSYSSFPLIFILLSLLIGDFFSAFLALLFAKEKIFPFSFGVKASKELISKAFPLGLMLVFNLVYFRIDSLIIASYKSAHDVGIYALSFLFFDFLLSIPLFLSNSIYPTLLSNRENKNEFSKLVKKYAFVYLGLSLILAVPFWFVSPLFFLIKPEFANAIYPFRILLLGLPFFFLTSFFQWILIAFKKTGYLVRVYFFLMCANVLLNLIFVPKGSYIASAFITGICEVFVFVLLFYKLVLLKKNN